MRAKGRPKKIPGKTYPLYLSLSKEELHALLKLIAKNFDETDERLTEQDLIRKSLRDLLSREGLLPPAQISAGQRAVPPDKRVQ
jgi:hypothetical protein